MLIKLVISDQNYIKNSKSSNQHHFTRNFTLTFNSIEHFITALIPSDMKSSTDFYFYTRIRNNPFYLLQANQTFALKLQDVRTTLGNRWDRMWSGKTYFNARINTKGLGKFFECLLCFWVDSFLEVALDFSILRIRDISEIFQMLQLGSGYIRDGTEFALLSEECFY